ncbi:hypothetical protein [Chakrabartyella piscis]|uniref:hypothetical protein n=1 Tax=Chakrabartyella piscis TaxID=2918914 RepID=UPI00295851D8|nr:hypothetical protein [Chakrabartyella piscis]
MKCENELCVYCNQGHCILDSISINALGMCDDAIQITINHHIFMKEKEAQLQELMKLQK